MTPTRGFWAVLAVTMGTGTSLLAADLDAEPIRYGTTRPVNAVSRLEERLAAGKAALTPEKKLGYLRSLLKELNVPPSSQVLVFSRTNLQRHRIGPYSPRALYFNDDVYVGFCQNGDVLEVSAADPHLGTVFYTVDQKKTDRVRITRQGESCLLCHGSSTNEGLPGHLLRSVYADGKGEPILSMGTTRIDQTSPIKQRWGGWYVTGKSGKQTHLGNLILEGKRPPDDFDNKDGVNVTDLGPYFKTSMYLTPHSDIVALMVLEHQAQTHNLITRANFLTRLALHDEAQLKKALGETSTKHSDSAIRRIQNAGEPLVKCLLFSEEAALTDAIEGTSGFAKEFSGRGPFDKKGRSLREFDLRKRMFKYPCSYLIYSAAFDGLPPEVKEYVYRRLWEVLTGKDRSKEFSHLSAADRQAVLELLRETKANLPEYWE
jgi:hypothetical protein